MQLSSFRNSAFRLLALLAVFTLPPCLGCQGGLPANLLSFDSLNLGGEEDLSQQKEFRQEVEKDPFPDAGRMGLRAKPDEKAH